MTELIGDKFHIDYAPPTDKGEGDINREMAEYAKWQIDKDRELKYSKGTRRLVELLEKKGRSHKNKEFKATIKDRPGVTNKDLEYLDQTVMSEMSERLTNEEIASEYEISKILSFHNHEETLSDNQNFIPVLPYQTQGQTSRLESDQQLIDITYEENWLDKEGEAVLDRLFEDSTWYTSAYRHIKSWNPRMVGYHDMMLVIQTLKGYREAPDARHFELLYQNEVAGVTLSTEKKAILPKEMQIGVRENAIRFNDQCMDLKLMVAAAGQIEYWKKDYLNSTFLKKFTRKQLEFVWDLFSEGKRLDIREVMVSKGSGSEDFQNKNTFQKFEKLVNYEIENEKDLKLLKQVPEHINNFFSSDPEHKSRKKYTATMIACLLTNARDRLLAIDPDYEDYLTKKRGIDNENEYRKIIEEVENIRDQILGKWYGPHKKLVDKDGKALVIKSSDIRLANITVSMNIQEAWSSLYSGILAGEYVYKNVEDEKDSTKRIWLFNKEVGGLHSASDAGDAYLNFFRKERYQSNNRDQGYIFLPDSFEQREEWIKSNELGYKPAIERYLAGGEKEDLVLNEMWNFVFSQEKKYVDWRAEYNLKMDPELAAFLKSLAFAWETPYVLHKKGGNRYDDVRAAVPIFILYPFVEYNFWNSYQIDEANLTDVRGEPEKNKDGSLKMQKVTPWYLMTEERRKMSSFTYENMKFNEMDYFDVTMDMWSEVFRLYYETPNSEEVEKRLINLYFLKRGNKKEDLGTRGLKNVIRVKVPKYRETPDGQFEIERNEDNSVKEELKFIPTEVFELGINPMIWAHHLSKKYKLLGPGGLSEINIHNFIKHISTIVNIESYYNPYKKTSKSYRDAAVLLTMLQALCLSRIAVVAGNQDRKDTWNKYNPLMNDVIKNIKDPNFADEKIIAEKPDFSSIKHDNWKKLEETKGNDFKVV
jgi:hypothetical protein